MIISFFAGSFVPYLPHLLSAMRGGAGDVESAVVLTMREPEAWYWSRVRDSSVSDLVCAHGSWDQVSR